MPDNMYKTKIVKTKYALQQQREPLTLDRHIQSCDVKQVYQPKPFLNRGYW